MQLAATLFFLGKTESCLCDVCGARKENRFFCLPFTLYTNGYNLNEKINQKAFYLFNVLGVKCYGISTKLAKILLEVWPCHWDATKIPNIPDGIHKWATWAG